MAKNVESLFYFFGNKLVKNNSSLLYFNEELYILCNLRFSQNWDKCLHFMANYCCEINLSLSWWFSYFYTNSFADSLECGRILLYNKLIEQNKNLSNI